MKPTIGRIVHYYCPSGDPLNSSDEPLAALITWVGSDDRFIDLAVFPPVGDMFKGRGVPFSDAPSPGYWTWPPRV